MEPKLTAAEKCCGCAHCAVGVAVAVADGVSIALSWDRHSDLFSYSREEAGGNVFAWHDGNGGDDVVAEKGEVL